MTDSKGSLTEQASGLVTVGQAATMLGLTYQGADYLVREGRIPVAERFGTYRMLRHRDVVRYVGLRDLQPKMANPATYNAGGEEFRIVAVMVRDATSGTFANPASVDLWLRKAELSNPPDSEQGQLVREAAALLREALDLPPGGGRRGR
jgi:hypothetical protein